jgi:DNA primase
MNNTLEDPINEIRARANIVDVIAESVVLKRSGRNFLGRCPFHQERTPSFNVNPERQIFRCFGCGEGGDIFTFVMKSRSLTFPDALRWLGERYGVNIPERTPEGDERGRLKAANEAATVFFEACLRGPEGANARSYLAMRGVTPEWVERFHLGYAPAEWEKLHRHLLEQGIDTATQLAGGLIRQRQNVPGHYDYFRNRLIFPIHNEAAQVVGFGARALVSQDEPKYLNSPETALYRKGQLLYGLNQARDRIRVKDRVILMEGYMDILTAHAYGFDEAVGVLGTALTPAQARILLRYTPSKRVVIAFDADRAGQQAAERGLTTLAEVTAGMDLRATVLAVPDGKDPDAFLRSAGAKVFGDLLQDAPALDRFMLERALAGIETNSTEGRARAVAATVPILRGLGNYVTQDHYITWLSERLGVRQESIRLEIKKGLRPQETPLRSAPLTVRRLSSKEAEHLLLYLMVERPDVSDLVREHLCDIRFESLNQDLREHLMRQRDAAGAVTWDGLLTHFSARPEVIQLLSSLNFSDYERWASEYGVVAMDCVNHILYEHWQGELTRLKEHLKASAASLTQDEHVSLVERLRTISEFCGQLKHRRGNIGH